MKVQAVTYAAELASIDLASWTVVVIDALRASSTIAQAVANGCRLVVPVSTIDNALRTRKAVGGADVLLCGEREGVRIDGFDLGNSPREYIQNTVAGKTLVFTTTNGTSALVASRKAREIIVGSFLNMNAVVRYLLSKQEDVLVAPTGRNQQPVLDDVVCAGMCVDLLAAGGASGLNGEAHLSLMAYLGYRDRLLQAALDSPSGQDLLRQGLGDDLPYCVQVGLLDIVPRVVDGQIWGGIAASPGV